MHRIGRILRNNFGNQAKTGNLKKHFGKLKRGLDGLEYQVSTRNAE
jgi:hypothetical protein